MADLLKNASELIQSEGFTGAHSLIFLIRYAFLAEKKSLMKLIGNTLEGLSGLEESASLVYAYAEYYKAEKAEFCLPALSFLIPRCRDDDPMLLPALAKAANVTGDERFLQLALIRADECDEPALKDEPFVALGFLELYRLTGDGAWLDRAAGLGEHIKENFRELFDPSAAYDMQQPSPNSATALLYDELSRLTRDQQWHTAREVQNRLIAMLADRYPTRVAFGLNALLADEFEAKTVVCMFPGDEIPPEVRSLQAYYSPLTEFIAVPAETDRTRYYLLKDGEMEELKGI